MRITCEKSGILTFVYIYLREFDGNIVGTLADIKAAMLYDNNNNWIGVEVYNISTVNNKIKINLPVLKMPHISIKNEVVKCTNENIYILFNSTTKVDGKMEVECNIDHNETGGLQGIEIILYNFNANLDIAKDFIQKH